MYVFLSQTRILAPLEYDEDFCKERSPEPLIPETELKCS